MRILFLAIFAAFGLFIASCTDRPSLDELKTFAATEVYPEDTFLDTVQNKRALIVVAHDDDDCAMAGTIAMLTDKGWKVRQLSFVSHPVDGEGQNPAGIICEGNEAILEDGYYRVGLDTIKNPYLPITREEMDRQFLWKKVSGALVQKINDFDPAVIFTLDNQKGGYGHPEHIFISQLVHDLFYSGEIRVQRIYQSVYTNHMEEEIVDTWLRKRMESWGYPHVSTIANRLYGIDGMPEPTVQVPILPYAQKKMEYLRAYPEDVRKNLRKFLPYYEEFDAGSYFSVFDREFFRVLDKQC